MSSLIHDLVKQAYNELGGLDNITLVAGHQQYHDDIHGFTTEHLLKHLKQMCIHFGLLKQQLNI